MHTAGHGIWRWNWKMKKKSEKFTWQELEYVEKTEKHGKEYTLTLGPGIWQEKCQMRKMRN